MPEPFNWARVPEDSGDFICPECGSAESSGRLFVSRAPGFNPEDPWSGVLQIVTCSRCRRTIPAHLGYRWNMTREQAQAEWQERYREQAV